MFRNLVVRNRLFLRERPRIVGRIHGPPDDHSVLRALRQVLREHFFGIEAGDDLRRLMVVDGRHVHHVRLVLQDPGLQPVERVGVGHRPPLLPRRRPQACPLRVERVEAVEPSGRALHEQQLVELRGRLRPIARQQTRDQQRFRAAFLGGRAQHELPRKRHGGRLRFAG